MDVQPTRDLTVPGMVRRFVERFGDLPQAADQSTTLTFRELDRDSTILGRALLARGLGKGARVGLLLPNGVEWMVAWFAITRIGAIAVQVSTFAAARELAHIVRHADLQLLITADRYLNHDYVDRLQTALPGLSESDGTKPLQLAAAPFLREIWTFGAPPAWARGDRGRLAAQAEMFSPELLSAVEAEVYPSDSAIMIYTSGSTSEPKAVVHSQSVVVRHSLAMSQRMNFQPGDRVLSVSPMFWVGGLCTSMLAANQAGAALVTPASQAPGEVIRTIREQKVTHAFLSAVKARALIGVDGFDEAELYRLKPCTATQQYTYGLASKEEAPDSLGMSETLGPHSMEPAGSKLPPERAGSFGRGVTDVERKIINPDTGESLPPGRVGELCVRGYSLMQGYYKRERAECFDADGWFHTGDSCSLDEEGFLYFHGRRTEMLKTSGANVAPREVELVLQEHEDVAEAAVVGLPHAKMGQMVVAAVTLKPDRTFDEAALRAWLAGQLSSFKVPKRILPLAAADMPRTDTGKVRKTELSARLEEMLATPA